jgi:hypothetical protein
MRAPILLGLLVIPVVTSADELYLRSGGHLSGVVVERRTDAIVLDVGPGRVTLPTTLVERIVESTPTFSVFEERASHLASNDVNGWLQLGMWARDRDLLTQSRQAFEHVVRVDPGNPVAHHELGHVQEDGRWMTSDDAYRMRGFVSYEGRWVTPDEREAMMAERAAQAQARMAEREADARAREAEARARTAEAEAARAEAEAAASQNGGIPLGLAYGGYGGYGPSYGGVYGLGSVITPGFVVTSSPSRGRHHGSMNGGPGGPGSGSGPRCATGGGGQRNPPPAPAPTRAPAAPTTPTGGAQTRQETRQVRVQ